MLSPLDDYPIHQISEPMRYVGTSDRHFDDRYYFNIHGTGEVHGTGEELFAVIGVGQYPNLSVADAFVSVAGTTTTGWSGPRRPWGPTAWTPRSGRSGWRSSRASNRCGSSSSPTSGASSSTPSTTASPRPISSPGTSTASSPGSPSTRPVRPGGLVDGLAQGRRPGAPLTPDRWWGSRDRSWGVRPVGEPEPPGIRVTDTSGGFFWIYAPVRFDDHAMVTIIQERPSGERIMQDAHRVFPLGSGREAEWLARPEHAAPVRPGTRLGHRRHAFLLRRLRGRRPPRWRSRPCWPSRCCSAAGTGWSRTGSTGCTRATWWSRARRSPGRSERTPPGRSPSTRPASPLTGRSGTGCSSARSMGAPSAVRVHRLEYRLRLRLRAGQGTGRTASGSQKARRDAILPSGDRR